ncbi:MAG TPA: phosphate ABC transporter substrate-binding protein PstS, partial [Cyanobacteria bacterium UBA8156]|nr:phosphate ABC transporter substrate-binding protein PstS [Cyanobacteria bacterium UBA8156]
MNFSTASGLGRAVALTLATATVSLTASFTVAPAAKSQSVTLNGAGASFPAPLYNRYFDEFRKETGIQVNYQSIGSGGGIRQFTAGTVDFGASDDFMSAAEIARVEGSGVLQIPTAGGSVAIAYNIPGVADRQLRLSRAVFPAIFTGEITRWNDPRIAAGNRGVNLPDAPIRVVVRADSSGTSAIFSSALAAVSPSFKGRVGVSKT